MFTEITDGLSFMWTIIIVSTVVVTLINYLIVHDYKFFNKESTFMGAMLLLILILFVSLITVYKVTNINLKVTESPVTIERNIFYRDEDNVIKVIKDIENNNQIYPNDKGINVTIDAHGQPVDLNQLLANYSWDNDLIVLDDSYNIKLSGESLTTDIVEKGRIVINVKASDYLKEMIKNGNQSVKANITSVSGKTAVETDSLDASLTTNVDIEDIIVYNVDVELSLADENIAVNTSINELIPYQTKNKRSKPNSGAVFNNMVISFLIITGPSLSLLLQQNLKRTNY